MGETPLSVDVDELRAPSGWAALPRLGEELTAPITNSLFEDDDEKVNDWISKCQSLCSGLPKPTGLCGLTPANPTRNSEEKAADKEDHALKDKLEEAIEKATFDLTGPLGQLWQRVKQNDKKIAEDYKAVGKSYSAQRAFRIKWCQERLDQIKQRECQKSHKQEIKDLVEGEYLPVRKIYEAEGMDKAGMKATTNYVTKCVKFSLMEQTLNGHSFMEYNIMTERYEFLYVKKKYKEVFTQAWKMVEKYESAEQPTEAEGIFEIPKAKGKGKVGARVADDSGNTDEPAAKRRKVEKANESGGASQAAAGGGGVGGGGGGEPSGEGGGAGGEAEAAKNAAVEGAEKAAAEAAEKAKVEAAEKDKAEAAEKAKVEEAGMKAAAEAAEKAAKVKFNQQIQKCKSLKTKMNATQASADDLVHVIKSQAQWEWANGSVDLENLKQAQTNLESFKTSSDFWSAWVWVDDFAKFVKKTYFEKEWNKEFDRLGDGFAKVDALQHQVQNLKAMNNARINPRDKKCKKSR